jgi:hypothetical protein
VRLTTVNPVHGRGRRAFLELLAEIYGSA